MPHDRDRTGSVSDPDSPDYNPDSPFYDVTADPSSRFYLGPPAGDHLSGDEIRAEVTDTVNQAIGPAGGFLDQMLGPVKNSIIQDAYQDRLESARQGLGENLALREPGEGPKTLWANASHEQMVEIINSNADSSAVAVTSEEWVRLGNDLADHQRALGTAINDSLGNWQGDAGDAARTYLAEVGKWLGSTAEGSVLTGRQQEIHSQALNETQLAMAGNPPVPFSAPEANARLARITDPVQFALQFSAELDTFHRQQAGREQAAQLMHQFDETVRGATTTPAFPAPPALRTRTMSPLMRTSSTEPTEPTLRRNAVHDDGTAPLGNGNTPNRAVPTETAPFGSGTGGGTGGSAPDGAVPGGAVPSGSAPGGAVPGGSAPGGAVPGGSAPGGHGTVPNVAALSGSPSGAMPNGTPTGAPGSTFSNAGIAGGVPPVPPMPDFTPPGGTSPSGLTGQAGSPPPGTVPTPNVPDLARGSTVPSSFPSGPGTGPTSGYTPPTFSRPSSQDGERTMRMPNPPKRPNLPNLPNVPNVPTMPGGGGPVRLSSPGSVPGMPGGGGPSGGGGLGSAPGGAVAGRGGGFGPVGSGGGGAVGAVPGGGSPGNPGGPGGGTAGGRGPGTSAPPPGGAGGAGAGGGQGEDKEYQVASYLEGDAEIFAPGKVVSPPVIGDWNSTNDWK